MIRDRSEMRMPIEIDLEGPDGNVYSILGLAKGLCKRLNKDWKDIEKRMTSSDYEHLIKVFDSEFGDMVTLYR